MSDLRAVLTPINMLLSVVMYYPLFKKILRRRSTADFSKLTQAIIVVLQCSSLLVAFWEHAWFLFTYYVLQVLLTTVMLWLVWRFSNEHQDEV